MSGTDLGRIAQAMRTFWRSAWTKLPVRISLCPMRISLCVCSCVSAYAYDGACQPMRMFVRISLCVCSCVSAYGAIACRPMHVLCGVRYRRSRMLNGRRCGCLQLRVRRSLHALGQLKSELMGAATARFARAARVTLTRVPVLLLLQSA
eukprot:1503751-Rhodomonas_salina.1